MGKRQIPRHLNHAGKKKSAGITVAVPAVCLLLLVILVGAVIGRYQRQFGSGGSVRAKEFYFTSDFLDGSTHTLAPGSTEVKFSLSNHADELRWSEVDIAYEVTVEPTGGATLSNGSGTLDKDAKSDKEVTITGLTPGTYTVTAVGTGGYKKTLTATIKVLPVESVVYKYLDTTNSEYVLLTVWAQGYKGSVTIQPPEGLIPDNTDLKMKDATTGAEFTDEESFNTPGNAEGYSSHTYRFFVTNDSPVTAGNFKVTYAGKSAAEKTPS